MYYIAFFTTINNNIKIKTFFDPVYLKINVLSLLKSS